MISCFLIYLFIQPGQSGAMEAKKGGNSGVETDGQDFIEDYLIWMRGPGIKHESLHAYNFGYQRNLPLPSIALTPDSDLRLNLQSSGMQTPSRRSIVVIGRQYLHRFQDIMRIIDKIHEDTQGNPLL